MPPPPIGSAIWYFPGESNNHDGSVTPRAGTVISEPYQSVGRTWVSFVWWSFASNSWVSQGAPWEDTTPGWLDCGPIGCTKPFGEAWPTPPPPPPPSNTFTVEVTPNDTYALYANECAEGNVPDWGQTTDPPSQAGLVAGNRVTCPCKPGP